MRDPVISDSIILSIRVLLIHDALYWSVPHLLLKPHEIFPFIFHHINTFLVYFWPEVKILGKL
jgi:hypothetical protein